MHCESQPTKIENGKEKLMTRKIKNPAEREKVSAVVSAGVAIGLVILADINDDFRCEIMGFKWYVWNVDGDKEPTCIRRR